MKYKPIPPATPVLTELERMNVILGKYAVTDHHAVCGKETRLKTCPYKKTHWNEAKKRLSVLKAELNAST